MASSLDKLASNLCDTHEIQCDKCEGYIELVNISSKYIALLECKRHKTKKKPTILTKRCWKIPLDTLEGIGPLMKNFT